MSLHLTQGHELQVMIVAGSVLNIGVKVVCPQPTSEVWIDTDPGILMCLVRGRLSFDPLGRPCFL
jgi:hypothetical protein